MVESGPKRPPERFSEALSTLFFILGTGIIIVAALGTLADLRDRVVFTILAPGVVVGLVLISLAVWIRRLDGRGRDNTRHGGT